MDAKRLRSHRIGHVHHCFGKVLSLSDGATKLDKLGEEREPVTITAKHHVALGDAVSNYLPRTI